MRLARAAAIALLSLAALLAAAVAIAMHNQARLINVVLRHIRERTGYEIVASGERLHFGTHLVVVLDHPSIEHEGRELMHSERVRVYLSYHALIWNGGLPLRALLIVHPELRVPASQGQVGADILPQPGGPAIRAVAQEFREFTGLVERVTIANALVSNAAGQPLLEEFSLTAAPRRRHAKIWNVGFIAPQIHSPLTGLELSGRMSIETGLDSRDQTDIIRNGELWFWNGRLGRDLGAGIKVGGLVHGNAAFGLRVNGEVYGDGNVAIEDLGAGGARLDRRIDFGDCSLKAVYAVSAKRIALLDVKARAGTTIVASGDLTLDDPFTDDASVLAHLSAQQIDLAALKTRLDAVHAPPKALASLAAALVSGQITVEGASYQTALKDLGWSAADLASALQLSVRLAAVSLKLPRETAIPALSQANAELAYAKGRVTLAQGSAAWGRSSFKELGGSADFRSGHRRIRYQLKTAGTLDVNELYTAAKRIFPALAVKTAGHVDSLSGSAAVRVTASGVFDSEAPAPPAKYLAKIDTSGLGLAARDLPQPIALVGGTVTLTPGNVELSRVMAAVDRPKVPGAVAVNGNLAFAADKLRVRQISVELHQVEVQQWLPLLVDPDDLAARGPLGGTLTIARAPSRSQGIRANGRLTMGAGEIELGFLRAPIVAESATLSFDGRGLLLAIVGAKLQGAPLDLSLGVADLDHPALRITANAGRLDLEVMKFIRLPWAPSPPAHFFPVPVFGHIEAAHANLERLAMSHVRCDFKREMNGDWSVHNFNTNMFDGHAEMAFSGRGRDDWINVKGSVDGVLAGPLFSLADPASPPPLSGRLKAHGDLWADSNTDFFNTMAGTVSIEVTDGVLHKFALLSRILGFVDLKTWLSAKVPDPRVKGVPFQTLAADFKGRDGDFYSDNLLLRGPVMNISALGHMRLSDGDVDMEVGMVPFKTVNWLVAKLPIIGGGLSSNHFVAAYFHVTGPLSNPHVVPQPITSMKFFLTNVLKLPLNIIKDMGQDGGNGN
jgi:AsmA-like protein